MSPRRPVTSATLSAAPEPVPVPPEELGLRWRPLTRADAADLFELVSAVESADALPYRSSPEEVAEWFDGSWKNHALDTLAGYGPDGRMCAYAQATVPPGAQKVVRVLLAGGVHPQWRRRGVGSAVVAWLVLRGHQLVAAARGDLPGRIATHLDDSMGDARTIYRTAGFAPIRYYTDMRRDLSRPVPPVEVPVGLRIVSWTPELDDAVRVAHNETFQDHWGSEPRTPEAWAQGRSTFAPEWSVVALDGSQEVVGYLMAGRFEQDWPVVGHTFGYVDLVGVRRPWRGRRLGTALLTAAMRAFQADEMAYAELGVDTANPSGAFRLYEGLGFEVTQGATLYSIELPGGAPATSADRVHR